MTESKKENLKKYGILAAALLVYNVLLILFDVFTDSDGFITGGHAAYILSCVPFFIGYGIASFLMTGKIMIPYLLLLVFELITTGPILQLNGALFVTVISLISSVITCLIIKIQSRDTEI